MDINADSEVNDVLKQYFGGETWIVEAKESGVNNTTRFVHHANGRYVLRIYENHSDSDKVNYECSVLRMLQQHRLSFQIPKPVSALNGDFCVLTPAGKLAVMFEYIDGQRADLNNPHHTASIGRATGELVTALEQIRMDLESAYEPYYELYDVHPLVTEEKLAAWLQQMKNGRYAAEAERLEHAIMQLQCNLPRLKTLPVQLVHSDIVAGNVLAAQDQVTAILDFEFVTPDLRAMDAAVFINEIIRHHTGNWELLEAFIEGYAGTAGLTAQEIEALPQLILLRSIVLCVHFLGRQWAGIDLLDETEPYIGSFANVHDWLERHRKQLLELCYKEFRIQEVYE